MNFEINTEIRTQKKTKKNKKEIKKNTNKYLLVQEKVNYDLDRNKFIS